MLVIQTPTKQDVHLKALVDSDATKNFCSDTYVRDKYLVTYPLVNPLRIRLADGSMSMARFGVNIEFNIGALKITQKFIVTRLYRIPFKPLYPKELLMQLIYPANKWHDC